MTDQYGVGQRIREFENEHGDRVIIPETDWVLFEDGARREVSPWGRLIPPPTDLYEKLQWVLKYRQIKLDLAIQQFDYQKSRFLLEAAACRKIGNAPNFTAEAAENELKKLQKRVGFCRHAVKETETKLEAAKPQRLKGSERCDAEVAARTEELINSIKSIEV